MGGLCRRGFLVAIASAGTAPAAPASGPRTVRTAPAGYPSNRLANIRDLELDKRLAFAYPDDDAPGLLLKLGGRVPDGVGPDGDVVGFSVMCPHKGFSLIYNQGDRTLNFSGRAGIKHRCSSSQGAVIRHLNRALGDPV